MAEKTARRQISLLDRFGPDGFFQLALAFVLFGVLAASISLGLVYRSSRLGTEFGNAGNFATGVASFFALLIASIAIGVVYLETREVNRSARRIWVARLRLEEAVHQFGVLTVQWAKADEVTARHAFLRQALENLKYALQEARVSGLYRVLDGQDRFGARGEYSLAAELAVIEAWVNEDLRNDRTDLGNTYFFLSEHARALDGYGETEIRGLMNRPLSEGPFEKLREIADLLGNQHIESETTV